VCNDKNIEKVPSLYYTVYVAPRAGVWIERNPEEMRTMPNFTKMAIKSTFIKLLNEKPLSQITVKDIVEECGVNRNSFYYHFQDIPALVEEIVTE